MAEQSQIIMVIIEKSRRIYDKKEILNKSAKGIMYLLYLKSFGYTGQKCVLSEFGEKKSKIFKKYVDKRKIMV